MCLLFFTIEHMAIQRGIELFKFHPTGVLLFVFARVVNMPTFRTFHACVGNALPFLSCHLQTSKLHASQRLSWVNGVAL